MPTSLFTEMERTGGGLEDQRALQIALELSMLGLNESGSTNGEEDSMSTNFGDRNRKSSNMTECVPVPSSEHVAEIVGRQGCKIKALRAKTNTYIKTPVRGEEPVFVVTGRKEDVNAAKREILSAADHFSQIRASRKNGMSGGGNGGGGMGVGGGGLSGGSGGGPPTPSAPGQTTIQVRVPYRVVGLVVGPKGATIKRIQQQTHTYIVTPSRDKEPVFEVTGLPDNVESARREIEAHIAARTGGAPDGGDDGGGGDYHGNGMSNGSDTYAGGGGGSDLVGGIYKPGSTNSAFTSYRDSNNIFSPSSTQDASIFTFPGINGVSTKLAGNGGFGAGDSFGGGGGFGMYDNDEGIGSPSFDPVQTTATSMWPAGAVTLFGSTSTSSSFLQRSSSLGNGGGSGASPQRLSPTSLIDVDPPHQPARRLHSDPMSSGGGGGGGGGGMAGLPSFTPLPNGNVKFHHSSSANGSMSSSPTDSTGSRRKSGRDCIVCFDSEVVAALVPCGHNLFCMECASRMCDKPDAECPVCHNPVSQALRIFS
ncbi:PREDICTED: RNA-binding protein MEX3B-like [Priapulus caudatus]|uniref:RNA-binding protein MEX3B-like n=1 Tax=Priapulus caudatus TaxID=37621 RepID=A0ABM1E2A2_PRICU|nr:PREDICTED: RNA-binding protein MEX3B-like [Priapulus caudatus]